MTSCVEGVSVDNKHQEHIEHLAVLLLDDGLEGMVNLPVFISISISIIIRIRIRISSSSISMRGGA